MDMHITKGINSDIISELHIKPGFTEEGKPVITAKRDGSNYRDSVIVALKLDEKEFAEILKWASLQPITMVKNDYLDRDWSLFAKCLQSMIEAQVCYTFQADKEDNPSDDYIDYRIKEEIRETWDFLMLGMDYKEMFANIEKRVKKQADKPDLIVNGGIDAR